jgi:hypothetical protein
LGAESTAHLLLELCELLREHWLQQRPCTPHKLVAFDVRSKP